MLTNLKTPRLMPVDRLLFWFLLRYGLLEDTVAQRLLHPEKPSGDAARCRLRRLKDRGYVSYVDHAWINPHLALAPRLRYWRLLPQAVDELEKQLVLQGVTPGTYQNAGEPLRVAQLPERFAVYAFCVCGTTRHRVLLQHEFRLHLPEYAEHCRTWPYYFERRNGTYILRQIQCDTYATLGRHYLGRIERKQSAAIRNDHIAKLDRIGHFRVTLLTGDAMRKVDLERALDEHGIANVDVELVSALAALSLGVTA